MIGDLVSHKMRMSSIQLPTRWMFLLFNLIKSKRIFTHLPSCFMRTFDASGGVFPTYFSNYFFNTLYYVMCLQLN